MELNELLKFLRIRAIVDRTDNTLKFLNGEFNLSQYIDSQILNREEQIRYYENRIKEEQIELETNSKKEKPSDYTNTRTRENIRKLEKDIADVKREISELNIEKQKLEGVK